MGVGNKLCRNGRVCYSSLDDQWDGWERVDVAWMDAGIGHGNIDLQVFSDS